VAKGIAAAAEDHARKNNWNVVITVLDDGGNLIYLQRMDGTQIGSIQVAIDKAKSAILFKRPTKAFADVIAKGGNNLLVLSGASPIEGGLPLEYQGQFIGSIGVSGVTSAQDGMIAQAGVDSLAKIAGN
jgi:uncharacterized protein GlcG (DUF336 family)